MSMPASRPRRLVLALALVLALGLAACSGSDGVNDAGASPGPAASPAGAAGSPAELVVAIGGDEGTLTPYTYMTGYPGWNLMNLVYDTLLVLDEESVVQPHLAESYEVSDDGLTWALTLADGVTWHDGEPVTAEDVAFTFDYVQQYTSSRFTGPASAATDVTADGNTVTFTLDTPNPEFAVRPLADMPIMPAHVWEDVDDPEAAGVDLAIGSGPYVLIDHTPDQSYTLTANEDYGLGEASLAGVTLSVIPEQQTAIAALQSGEVQAVTDGIPPQLVEQLEQAEDVEVVTGPEFGSTLLVMNNGRGPFDVPEVRQAISRAIDIDDLVDTVLLGQGTPGDPGFVHPESPYASSPRSHVFDPQEAVSLLEAAGATEGEGGVRELAGEPLSFDLLVYADAPDRLRTAELIRDQLAEVGVEVTIDALDADSVDALVWPEFDVANGRDYDMALWGWSAPVMLSPGRLVGLVDSDPSAGSINVTGTSDPRLDELSEAVLAAPVQDSAETAAADLADGIAQLVPFVTLYYPDGVYAYDGTAYDGWVFQNGQGILSKLSLAELSSLD